MIHIVALFLSFLLTASMVLLFMKIAVKFGVMLDHPNYRKIRSHNRKSVTADRFIQRR